MSYSKESQVFEEHNTTMWKLWTNYLNQSSYFLRNVRRERFGLLGSYLHEDHHSMLIERRGVASSLKQLFFSKAVSSTTLKIYDATEYIFVL